ncbi:hypothetical protein JW964_08410 [candidate division KSB1 bacterium]|nr:hypothetical protein [candidate division KSB1 bacterium]
MGKKKRIKPQKKKSSKIKPKLWLAQQRNQFLREVSEIADAMGLHEAFQLIPKSEYQYIANLRIHPLELESAPDHDIPPEIFTIARLYINEAAKYDTFVTITTDGGEISLYDYFRVVLTFYLYLRTLDDGKYKTAKKVKQSFVTFIEFVEHCEDVNKKLIALGNEVGLFFSRINHSFYWFMHSAAFKEKPKPLLCTTFLLHRLRAEKTDVYLDGIKRPVYRVGWILPNEGMRWATVKAVDLGLTGSFSSMPLDVYIQSHALIRLKERVDFDFESAVHFFLWQAFTNVRTVRKDDDQIMVEYNFFDHKIGYLVIDIIEGKVIIRTFLFLTNSGTPEGENLKKILGLKLSENKYLELDKLSTFIGTDLRDDPELKEIFTRVGCGSLFELANRFDHIEAKMHYAQKITQYLRLHDEFEY